MDNKIVCFDYFISSIIRIIPEEDPVRGLDEIIRERLPLCGLNKLKLMKLLFFVSAKQVDGSYLVDDIFDKFCAMPYGPVESDVYSGLDGLKNFILSNQNVSLIDGAALDYSALDSEKRAKIDRSISAVYEAAPELFRMDTFDLVELSHKSDAWRIVFAEAKRRGKASMPIPNEIIKTTTVYFK